MAAIHNPVSWGEYGLLGLLFGAFVSLLFLVIRTGTKKDREHQAFVTQLLSDEREERNTVTDRFSKSTDRLSDALTDLSTEIAGTNRVQREAEMREGAKQNGS